MAGNPKFSALSKLKYKDQAIWFLNGFWADGVDHTVSMKVWDYVKKFVELDMLRPDRKGENGNELDQFWSAKFLEDMDTAMPSTARKEALRSIDQDSNGKMSCIEYLVWKYKKGVQETADAPQGDNTAAIKIAQQKLDEVQFQLADCETKLQAQKTAKEENDKALAELAHQERELAQAIADLNHQQDEFTNKLHDLETKSHEGGVVSKNKAAAELAQLKAEDPLPLRKAKLTSEAAKRKVDKAKEQTEIKGKELEHAISDLEAAYQNLEKKMEEARAELDKIKSKPGGGKGAIWWMQRELFEADGRLPKAKQKFDHSHGFTSPF